MKKKPKYTKILHSCLTGKVVWIYRGPSREAMQKAYQRACKKEIERVRNWSERMARRTASITRLLTDLLADKPIDEELTPEQQEAAKELQAISKKQEECHSEFYKHIMEERRRRDEDREIRRKMRENAAKKEVEEK
jgi:hypothetical protein